MRFSFFNKAVLAAGVAAGIAASTSVSQARVNVRVDVTTQTMHVTSASGSYTWKVSTGRGRFRTPRGTYRPTVMRRMHYSSKYNNSPMPYSVFFRGGYAIHGTSYVNRLGSPASHGCIRLATPNAAALYSMIKREGARITIVGSRAKFYANKAKLNRKYASAKGAARNAAKRHTRALRYAKAKQARAERRAKYLAAKRYKARKLAAKRLQRKKYLAKRHQSRKLAAKRYRSKKYYAKRYKSRKYAAKRYKSRKYAAKRYNKRKYAKRYKSKRKYAANKRYKQKRAIASRASRSAPLAYAPIRRTRSTFDFFRNPNNY